MTDKAKLRAAQGKPKWWRPPVPDDMAGISMVQYEGALLSDLEWEEEANERRTIPRPSQTEVAPR